MSDLRTSPATRALFQAAKADGPDAAARTRMWSGVSSAVGGVAAAGGAAAASGSAVGTASAAKLIAFGTLLGGAVTVGIATLVIRLVPAPPAPAAAAAAAPATTTAHAPVNVSVPVPVPATATATAAATETAKPQLPSAPPARPTPARATAASGITAAPEDALTREASLVAEARGALVRGDAAGALRAVRAARALPSHLLEPEELAVEAQALRALGRTDEAKGVDGTLRSQYPDSALAR